MRKFHRLITILAFACVTVLAQAQELNTKDKFLALNFENRPEVVTFSLREMTAAILTTVGDRPFSAHQFLGFSGASFFDMPTFESEFTQRALDLNRQTLKRLGPSAVTVYILGATGDGFGKGYEILNNLISAGKIKNALVTGMASSEAMVYHLEGLEKGWGHVVDPHQKIVYFKSTFTDSSGHQSWELKDSPRSESDTPKVLKDLSRAANAGFMTFNVFGGGYQAFNETLEMILESRNRPQKIAINLNINHRPGKPKKDTGYRAADMLAYVLSNNQYLLNGNIDVRIFRKDHDKKWSVQDFYFSAEYQKLKQDLAAAPERLAEYKSREMTAELQGLINYYEVLLKLDSLPLKEIENFRLRSSEGLDEARMRLIAHDFPDSSLAEDSVKDRIDNCAQCLADIAKVTKQYQRKNKCQSLLVN